jgi:hypothetical protein
MTDKIKENINNPEILERLYRNDRKSFESGFEKIYPEIENSEMAKFWKSRLDFHNDCCMSFGRVFYQDSGSV